MKKGFSQLQDRQHVPGLARREVTTRKASTQKHFNSSELGTVKWLKDTNFVSDLELDSCLERVVADNE